jgi:hypothetical protein
MKMLLKSNKGSGNFPPLQSIINDKQLQEFAYNDEEKCILVLYPNWMKQMHLSPK